MDQLDKMFKRERNQMQGTQEELHEYIDKNSDKIKSLEKTIFKSEEKLKDLITRNTDRIDEEASKLVKSNESIDKLKEEIKKLYNKNDDI